MTVNVILYMWAAPTKKQDKKAQVETGNYVFVAANQPCFGDLEIS